jgi:hypothetical protein
MRPKDRLETRQWRDSSGPIAEGRKPCGKGFSASLTAVIRPRLTGAGAERACPGGRQARPDWARAKSGKKKHAMLFA